MTTELFAPETVAMKSPRLLWLESNDIRTADCGSGGDSPETGEYKRWCCWSGDMGQAMSDGPLAEGDTEDEAITEWAKMHDIRLWNESGDLLCAIAMRRN